MLLLKITYLHDNIRKVRIQALGVIEKGFRLNNDQLVNICHGDVVKEVNEPSYIETHEKVVPLTRTFQSTLL